MHFLELFITALLPVLKLLLIIGVGSFLAMERFNILGKDARKNLNIMVFFVFTPSLVYSSLANAITFKSILMLWYMPLNVLFTFIIGTVLGWLLVKITKIPDKLQGLVLGCCSSGNLGFLPLVIVPAVCKESNSFFGAVDICHKNAMAYASLSAAIGTIFIWTYSYNLVRIYSCKSSNANKVEDSTVNPLSEPKSDPEDISKCSVGSLVVEGDKTQNNDPLHQLDIEFAKSDGNEKVAEKEKILEHLRTFAEKLNLKKVLSPSTIGTERKESLSARLISAEVSLFNAHKDTYLPLFDMQIIGVIIGVTPPLRKALIGDRAPLRVVQDSISMMGDAAIPIVTLLVGGNLLKGLKGSCIGLRTIVGIIMVRNIALPILGVGIIKGAAHFGLIHHNPLYQFALLLQFVLPPAVAMSTITQLFGAGVGECSVIMLATYAFAAISLTLWSTFFMWLVQ